MLKPEIQQALDTIKPFIGTAQMAIMKESLKGEEASFFAEKALELAEIVTTMPKSYETDGQGDQAMVRLHYFVSGCHFHITERDVEAEQQQAFGLANLGYGGELGYISIEEILENGAELDFYWQPKMLMDIKLEQERHPAAR